MSVTEPNDEMVEAAARAMFEVPGTGDWTWDDVLREEPGRADVWRDDARSVLRAALAVAPAPSEDDLGAGEVARIKQVLDTHLPDIITGLSYATRSSQSKSRDELTPEETALRAALSAAHWIAKKVEPGTLPPTESFDLPSVLDLMELFKKLGGWEAIRALDTRRSPLPPPEDVTALIAEARRQYDMWRSRAAVHPRPIELRLADALEAAALRAPVPVESEAVAWRREVAEGTGYLTPETGEIAPASTVVAAFRENEVWANDYREIMATAETPRPAPRENLHKRLVRGAAEAAGLYVHDMGVRGWHLIERHGGEVVWRVSWLASGYFGAASNGKTEYRPDHRTHAHTSTPRQILDLFLSHGLGS